MLLAGSYHSLFNQEDEREDDSFPQVLSPCMFFKNSVFKIIVKISVFLALTTVIQAGTSKSCCFGFFPLILYKNLNNVQKQV